MMRYVPTLILDGGADDFDLIAIARSNHFMDKADAESLAILNAKRPYDAGVVNESGKIFMFDWYEPARAYRWRHFGDCDVASLRLKRT